MAQVNIFRPGSAASEEPRQARVLHNGPCSHSAFWRWQIGDLSSPVVLCELVESNILRITFSVLSCPLRSKLPH